jgi:hypothetical protein
MGALKDKLELDQKVFGRDIVDFYRKNTSHMYEKYKKSDKDCLSINKEDIQVGRFYFLHYLDDSNWMRWSPIFCCDYRRFKNMIVILGVNFNFIPLELRVSIFDKFITENNMKNNDILEVDFKGMYSELLRYGFDYSIQEYNVAQIKIIHQIDLNLLPRFLYSSYPKNTYDPKKLLEIWKTKLETKEERHREIISSVLSDFYEINKEISDQYQALKEHISRLQDSYEKYGKS